ncbi:MAG: hypothetical protein AAB308_13445 [Nitrospirota bacterium]
MPFGAYYLDFYSPSPNTP